MESEMESELVGLVLAQARCRGWRWSRRWSRSWWRRRRRLWSGAFLRFWALSNGTRDTEIGDAEVRTTKITRATSTDIRGRHPITCPLTGVDHCTVAVVI